MTMNLSRGSLLPPSPADGADELPPPETPAPPDDPAPLDGQELENAASLFHGLSDPSRLLILTHLALGEHRVVDLTDHLGLAQSTVSKHLACLRDCGLIASRPQGRASLWSLTHAEATADLVAAARTLLALTGDAPASCPTAHTGGPR